jgi:glycogen operon protein
VLRQDLVLGRLKLLTEPWDVGPGGYQLGNFPPGFPNGTTSTATPCANIGEGDPGQRGDLAARLADRGTCSTGGRGVPGPASTCWRRMTASPWPIPSCMSGTEANKEDNRDGHSENYSRNWGAEGRPTIRASTRRAAG